MPRKSVIDSALNLHSHERKMVLLGWLIRLFFKIGFVVGWTLLTVLFVARFGIETLPYLFVFNSIFIIFGTYFASHFLSLFKTKGLMQLAVFCASGMLFIASLFVGSSDVLFVFFMLIAESIFITQLRIFIYSFTEELFTPLESERTFPVIESAETIGGIIGGAAVMSFSTFIEPYKLLYLWIFSLCVIALIISAFDKSKTVPHLLKAKRKKCIDSDQISSVVSYFRKTPFLKGLLLVVAGYWVFYHLIELQFTTLVAHHIHGDEGMTFEQALTHGLGGLHILFSISALVIQLFVASRMIAYLGIVGSLLMHPVIIILSVAGMIINPGYLMAVLAKNNFEVGGIIHLNAYHTSYYAIPRHMRDLVREFLEGYVRPLGTLVGMIVVILLERFFHGATLSTWINGLLLVVGLVLFVAIYRLQHSYTHLSKELLTDGDSVSHKHNAIEILLQKGHRDSHHALIEVAGDSSEGDEVRINAIRALAKLHEFNAIPCLIDCFSDESYEVRLEAVLALESFKDIAGASTLKPFARYRIIESLKKLFKKEKNREIRYAIVGVLARFNKVDIVEYLLKFLRGPETEVTADCIYACGLFKDPNVIPYVEKYLHSKNINVKANALVALWQFPEFHKKLRPHLTRILNSKDRKSVLAKLFVLSEISVPRSKKYLESYLYDDDNEVRMMAAFAMAKRNDPAAVPVLASLLFCKNKVVYGKVFRLVNKLSQYMQDSVWASVRKLAAKKVRQVLSESDSHHLSDFSRAHLLELQFAYEAVSDHETLDDIRSFLSS